MKYKYQIALGGQLYTVTHDERSVVLNQIKKLLTEHKIPFVEDDLLRSIDRQSKVLPKIKKKSMAEVVAGARALLKYAANGSVAPQEMLERSEICQRCPLINTVSGCQSCGGAGIAAKFINSIRSFKKLEVEIPKAVASKYCGFCGCSIPLMVVTKLEDFYPETPEKNSTRPDNCWLKK